MGHPQWCARDHRCTARFANGEHRSDPVTWATEYGRFVVTRVETTGGRQRLEVRAVVELDSDEQIAQHQAQELAVRVDLAIRAARKCPPPNAS